jgi:hypothetical protein
MLVRGAKYELYGYGADIRDGEISGWQGVGGTSNFHAAGVGRLFLVTTKSGDWTEYAKEWRQGLMSRLIFVELLAHCRACDGLREQACHPIKNSNY